MSISQAEVDKMKNLGKRSLILFELPHMGDSQYIEMYINPQNIQFTSRKHLTETRTKGGFIMQYWGEDLDIMNLQGTTGASGIEGINVLRDIYRSEQLALIKLLQTYSVDKRRQSLAQLAASVILWYQGVGYKGYFTDMNYTESAAKLGLFDYAINMKITGIIGNRQNFMPWHRSPWSTSADPINSSNFNYTVREGKLSVPPIQKKYKITKDGVVEELYEIPYDPKRKYVVPVPKVEDTKE